MSSKREKKKAKKKSHVLRKIFLTLLIILVILVAYIAIQTVINGGGAQGLLLTLVGNNSQTLEKLDPLRVLVMGVSTDNGGKLTDTIMIASYNPKTQEASLLSIPRDTYVGTNEEKASAYDKINALYQKSPEKTLEAVNRITGLELKYYVVIDTQALIKLVDVIGGVNFYVPQDMVYDDPTQDLHINLKEGLQKLDGNKAEHLLRYRHGNKNGHGGYIGGYSSDYGKDDIGRMKTQRNFIMETIKQTVQAKNILKIKDIVDIVYEYIETNIAISTVKDYIPYAININIEGMKSEYLPGVGAYLGPQQLSFYKIDEKKAKQIIEDLYSSENKEDENTSNEKEPENSNEQIPEVSKQEAGKIKIEILNGSGSSKKLNDIKKALTNKGYKVTKTTNTTSTSKTTIINKTDVKEDIEKNIKGILGVGVVSTSSVSSSDVDITIIIGKDYK